MIKIPEGWRQLEIGEIVKPGDKWISVQTGYTHEVATVWVGCKNENVVWGEWKIIRMVEKKELYAFWTYDQFPFVLGQKVVSVCDDFVDVQGYGKFPKTQIKLIPLADGLRIKEELNKLMGLRYDMLKVVEDSFQEKRNVILKEIDSLIN